VEFSLHLRWLGAIDSGITKVLMRPVLVKAWAIGLVLVFITAVFWMRTQPERSLRARIDSLKMWMSVDNAVRILGEPVDEVSNTEDLDKLVGIYLGTGVRVAPIRGKVLVYRTSGVDRLFLLYFSKDGLYRATAVDYRNIKELPLR
jgi:hypothetical protein